VFHVTIRSVGKDIAGMVGDDVEDDVDPLLVGGLDEVAELLPCPEMRIDIEEVLNAVAVVARLEPTAPEGGSGSSSTLRGFVKVRSGRRKKLARIRV
jgi:hypothetical protein